MSSFDELLELLNDLDLEEIEPEELAALCTNPVFRALCAYCGARDVLPPAFKELLSDA